MVGCRHAVVLAALFCLPAIAYSDVPLKLVTHVTYAANDVVTGRAASTDLGGWEVTAGFDPVRCEIYCIYRQKPNASGRAPLLAPPITIVEVYAGAASKPVIVTFDPAGLGLPAATSKFMPGRETVFLPGRKLAIAARTLQTSSTAFVSYQAGALAASIYPDLTAASITPLRI